MTNVLNEQSTALVTPDAIKQGDQAAFLSVYNALHIKVFRFFLRRVLTNDNAKDLTQQCFIRLWQFRHTLSDNHGLEKQVFVIAHSLLINHFEKQYHQGKIKQQQLRIQNQGIVPSVNASLELADEIKTAIDGLSPVRKKVLLLKAFHDFSNREIAQEMNISVKTVEDHISKAFRRMKKVMTLIGIPIFFQVLQRIC